MTNDAFKDIEKLETDLWEAADNLRANSKLTSSDYFMPVLGIIFLRHAANRFDAAHRQIEIDQASGKMPKRKARAADYIARRALFLPEQSRYDWIMQQAAVGGTDLSTLVTEAMTAIESEFTPLQGILPKDYAIFETKVLEDLMRQFNSEQIKQATGDVFGRIYEYFLAKFSIQKAHDNGEFFTPSSLVQTIVNVIEPDHGTVFDPACGSGGMFVQSSHFIEHEGGDTTKRVVFYGQEKNHDTIRIAKMNLAVHGLEGNIAEAITYYQDEFTLYGKCDFVMANPPFNVDLVDAQRVKGDPRLPFGLPSVNKQKKVGNGNYLWISYFYSYLNETGRAGFVMSSQASSAGHGEKEVRKKIVETGDVDVMISIRPNFFYTRTVPCELWFFDRGKPAQRKDTVLMLDARNVYRKVTRKIFDFSPEQMHNLAAIVWLYRGQPDRFLSLLERYFSRICVENDAVPTTLSVFEASLTTMQEIFSAFAGAVTSASDIKDEKKQPLSEAEQEWRNAVIQYEADAKALRKNLATFNKKHGKMPPATNADQHTACAAFGPYAKALRSLVKGIDTVFRGASNMATQCMEISLLLERGESDVVFDRRAMGRRLKQFDAERKAAAAQLKRPAYFHRQVVWMQERFPKAVFQDVPGLVKQVDRAQIEAADWSLTPGRYVGIAPTEEDENFDFEQTMRDLHAELADLNREAAELANRIQTNFKKLGI